MRYSHISPSRALLGWGLTMVLLPLVLSTLAFVSPKTGEAAARGPAPDSRPGLEARAAVISRGLGMAEEWYRSEVEPVEEILRPYHRDREWVRHVAVALVREGRRADMSPRALASVLLVENPWLDPDIRSPVGAVGLMQVMPFHAGEWGCGSDDLEDVATNVCHGARIFRSYLEAHGGDVDRALLAYNGCVRGTNTPDCHLYPRHVFARAGRAAVGRWLGLD